ncbi:hypothetical protein M2A_3097 [Tepidicaulis marinus]|uniref:Uncharacterized protein n=1 Tax=Tepidicaulis marinus TaxID=1333998 RepID=A0A081BEY0_9HYPH|nr:hypothetical protein M2A_3097 [Tepidicaulis marinus]
MHDGIGKEHDGDKEEQGKAGGREFTRARVQCLVQRREHAVEVFVQAVIGHKMVPCQNFGGPFLA